MDNANTGIVVAGFIRVASKDWDAFLKVLEAHIPRVRHKDGCIAYSFAADIMDPNLVRMSEAWRDQTALDAHLASDEFRGTLKELASVEIIARSVHKYDVSSITDI